LFVCVAGSTSCGSDSGDVGLGTGGCLSDQQICQFKKGVSTETDVKNALGNAQMYVGPSAIYVCQQISGQQIVHNDLVAFDFDSMQVLQDVTVLRQGTGATPPPDCSAMTAGTGGQGAGAP
jgi:hypothetical protein